MSETYTPSTLPPETNNQPEQNSEVPIEIEDNFAAIQEIQATQDRQKAAEVARRLLKAPTDASDTKGSWKNKAIVATSIITGVAGVAGGVAGTAVVLDNVLPGEQVASASTMVRTNEGIEQSVDRDIAEIESTKIDPADATERQDVISQAIDLHTDNNGIVQPGENIEVIAEKSPIFGNITYKATPNTEAKSETDIQLPLPPALNEDGTIPAPETH